MRQKLTVCLTLLLLFALLKGNALAVDDKPTLSGEEIVNKYLTAAGGKQALTKFKSRVAIGTFNKEGEPEARMAIMSEAPDRVAAVYVLRDFDWRLIYAAGSVIIRPQFPRQVSVIEDKYREMLSSGLMFNGISLHNLLVAPGPDVKFEAKGMKKVKGRQAHVVELKRGKESPVRLYFDAENFMWVRTDFGRASVTKQMRTFTNDVVNQGASETTVDFYVETSDFREVDGVKLPFRVEMVVTSPILRDKSVGTIVGNIKEYQHDAQIDPKMFQ
jgi:hypothetical protein